MRLLREKYVRWIASGMAILLTGFLSISQMPFLHNIDAEFNVWNVKSFIILEGEHHHEPNPQSACFDYHIIKIKDAGECLGCQIVNNFRFLVTGIKIDFLENNKYTDYFIHKSLRVSSHYFNLPQLRAPPAV